jgi:hypothetical protein
MQNRQNTRAIAQHPPRPLNARMLLAREQKRETTGASYHAHVRLTFDTSGYPVNQSRHLARQLIEAKERQEPRAMGKLRHN